MSPRRRRVAIAGHVGRPAVRRAAAALAARLRRRGCETRLEEALAHALGAEGRSLRELAAWCQLLVTLGGDGSVLTGGRALAGHRGALLGVNFGGLGFLAAAEQRELDEAVDAALAGAWPFAARRLLQVRVERRGRAVLRSVAMNDAVVKGAGGYAAIHLRMRALGEDLGHLVADGVIASTAAGSTAYSLSAGGPVLAPEVEALVVTPVCAHSLGSRSLVLPAHDEVAIRLIGALEHTLLMLDGQEHIPLEPGDEVRIRLDRAPVRVLRNPARPFARTLRAKLGWQGSAKRSM
ncbi:MAG TPA: NAD(+)/NADH kinase [Terriglobales bacterium]|nr:NAD(+)/NADH kinase [Terriglobales bacterium]